MSMPKFPEIDSEMTCEYALNMILTSIAMEELALSHIINAEGEKLQYVLKTFENDCGKKHSIDDILKVNQSITCLLDSVAQNQMILKSKMDKAVHALLEICPGKFDCYPEPPGYPAEPCDREPEPVCKCSCKCSATFKAAEKCQIWYPDSVLHWNAEHTHGKCVYCDIRDKTRIELRSKGRFMISFSINVRTEERNCNAAVSLQTIKNHQRTNIYTVHSCVPCDDTTISISMSNIIVGNSDCYTSSPLLFKLESPCPLIIEDSMLSIIEI